MFDPKTIDPRDITVGDYVRSHDFINPATGKHNPDRPGCFIDGWVRGFEVKDGVSHYIIQVTGRVFDDTPHTPEHGEMAMVPENGTPRLMGGECLGVELLRRPINELYTCDGDVYEKLNALKRSMYDRVETTTPDLLRDMAKTLEHLVSQLIRTE